MLALPLVHLRRSLLWLTVGFVVACVVFGQPASADTASPPDNSAPAATGCAFGKADAVAANGGPLGKAIWGRLCQEIDGAPTYADGVTITVSKDGAVVGTATSADGGIFVVPIPGNGTYQVALDTETLPNGFTLTDSKRATLDGVSVNLGDQQVAFPMGEGKVVARSLGDYLTTMVKGLRLGLILAVAAVGLSMVYSVTALVNFAHAELVTVGAIFTFGFNTIGVPFWISVILAMIAGGIVGALNDIAIFHPLTKRRMSPLAMMVVSIGVGIAARNLLQIIFGESGRRYAGAADQRERKFGPLRLTPNDLTIIAICVVVLIALVVLLRKTRLGTAIRAVADNPDLAASSGIAVDRIVTIVWVLCGALTALAGTLYGLTLNVKFDMGFILLLSMFAAVVLGGLGSVAGAILGAIIIGVVQETSGLFIDTAYKFVVALAVLILVLLFRPQGLLGKKERFG